MRFALIIACALVLGTGTAATASSAPPRAELRSFVCQKALDPPMRAVSIQAVMRPLTGTARMQMRFDLMRQSKPGGPFRLVRGRLLGRWISPSDPTLGTRPGDVWIVNHPVVDLGAPATYRFRVQFRWTDSHGSQLGSVAQSSANCIQRELRADLVVRSISVVPAGSGTDAYDVVIANRGQTAAGPVEVDFAGAGTSSAATVASVGARSTAHHRFLALSCTPGSNLTVTVDPSHTIDEADFANNALTIPCPAPAGN